MNVNAVLKEDRYSEALPQGATLLGDQFTITDRLGAGGFGITYRAQDNVLGRTVVIKECFSADFCRRDGKNVIVGNAAHEKQYRSIVEMFMREARSLAKLRHPNIVGVHRAFEENQTAYMALDLIEGQDLLDFIDLNPDSLTPELVTDILMAMLDAVQKIHERDLLHRDISPDNIMIEKDGTPVLIDFGAARGDASRRTRAVSSLLVVKEGYSPKELYLAGSMQTPASDLYALGATFYHVLAGEPPIDSQTRMASLASNKPDPSVPLVGRVEGYQEAFLAAIDKAMQTLPDDRLQSAQEWREMIAGPATKPEVSLPEGPKRRFAPLSLTDLVKQTNEEVRKTRMVEPEPVPEPEPAPVRRRTKVIDTNLDWIAEFNQETEATAEEPALSSIVEESNNAQPPATSLDEGLFDLNPPETEAPEFVAEQPQETAVEEEATSDWISRARHKQRRTQIISTPHLDAVLSPSDDSMGAEPLAIRSRPHEETYPTEVAEPKPTLRELVGPLFKYLSTGIVIGLSLIFIQMTYFA